MEYAIEMRGVNKRYKEFSLENIDIHIPKGSVVGLIGENGAGKTTLIKALLGLVHIDEGEIWIQGSPMECIEKSIKEEIGAVFDENSFPENLKLQQIEKIMPSVYANWDAGMFDKLTERFGLSKTKQIKEFSRGMKMKLNIAAALSHQANLLVLDEATGGLDPVVRDEILELFQEFMESEEHSILLSSHITSDIEKIADYVVFIKNGKIIFQSNKDELLYQYGILKCAAKDREHMDHSYFVAERDSSFQCEILIRQKQEFIREYPDAVVDPVTLDMIMLFYGKGEVL